MAALTVEAYAEELAARVVARGLPLESKLVRDLIQIASGNATYRPHPDWKFRSMEEFVLLNGVMWRYQAKPGRMAWGTPKQCFNNCFNAIDIVHGTNVYVEGYATTGIIPAQHAWLGQPKSRTVIDLTWNPKNKFFVNYPTTGWEYIGVPFETRWYIQHAFRTGKAGVIDRWEDDYPLLRGEPFERVVLPGE
jgi:hypothetical protein